LNHIVGESAKRDISILPLATDESFLLVKTPVNLCKKGFSDDDKRKVRQSKY
jgi:hypothetical protein